MNHFTFRNLAGVPVGKATLLFAFLLCGLTTFAQVTTSTITGLVTDSNGEGLIGATVVATHVPSGTRYGSATNALGRYTLPAVRVGGPFMVTITYTGYEPETREGVYTSLGTAANVDFVLREAGTALGEVTITATKSDIFSSERTGAATTFNSNVLRNAPNVGARSINSITKYSPYGNGSSFGAQDSRLNNFTIDGSVFNNGFGLGTEAQAGGRTGSTAISLDAIEELQMNIAPFDVRQTGFVGSGINAVTRSGTNEFTGSAFYNMRKNDNSGTFNRTEFKDLNGDGQNDKITIGQFDEKVYGLSIGGPIIKDKLFFFANGEMQRRTEPATTWVATGSPLEQPGGNTSRTTYDDLVNLSNFLRDKYGYETGPFENYDNETSSDKFLVRLDYNINDRNKLTLRYVHHNSDADQLISNSSSLGRGNRRTNANSMSYQNSGYIILDNTRSGVLEWNHTISDRMHNTFLVGYDKQIEDRAYKGAFFPTIDIMQNGSTYIGAGFDPFTPDNKLDYGTFHVTDNVSLYREKHTFTFGANYEYYKSNNLFFPGNNGVWIYNSLQEFYDAANGLTDTSNRFQFRYSALPEFAKPLQVLKVHKIDFYGQDEYQISNRFKLTYGIRAGVISFEDTGIENPTITEQEYIDVDEKPGYKINTGKMPPTKVLWEPRIGFNWDATGKKTTQIRGGTGIFTGRPPYVWVSNAIGNNGVLTGFIDVQASNKYGFTPDVNAAYTPETPTLPSTFDIAAIDPDYRFPQVWKSDIAIDQKLPLGFIITGELLYNKNLNAVLYFDANLEQATRNFAGPDQRSRFPASGVTGTANINNAVRINDNVSRAAVMATTNEGYYFGATLKLEYPSKKGLYGMFAYTYSEAKDLMSAGSIASGSWTGARAVNGNNNLTLAFADQDIPDRLTGLLGYRFEYGGDFAGATSVSIGYVGENRGFNPISFITTSRFSYSYVGDMNGDGVADNELLFVPTEAQLDEMIFDDITGATPFTAAEQRAAYNAFIEQDDYLKTRRGQYAERNGVLFPMVHRFDLSVVQEFSLKIGKKRNRIQFRADILNAMNLFDSEAGLGNNAVNHRPVVFRGVTADGQPKYQLATQSKNGQTVLIQDSFTKSRTQFDVWSAQFGIRYIFD
ncbi:MAG TPA: carboxypeptidase regulatory-like domain-containing protein [Saprospiraceae bacterium]|nr:carboxypeptidase regulatory-like domain-containing protein [Saprospiraceae bacterium]